MNLAVSDIFLYMLLELELSPRLSNTCNNFLTDAFIGTRNEMLQTEVYFLLADCKYVSDEPGFERARLFLVSKVII